MTESGEIEDPTGRVIKRTSGGIRFRFQFDKISGVVTIGLFSDYGRASGQSNPRAVPLFSFYPVHLPGIGQKAGYHYELDGAIRVPVASFELTTDQSLVIAHECGWVGPSESFRCTFVLAILVAPHRYDHLGNALQHIGFENYMFNGRQVGGQPAIDTYRTGTLRTVADSWKKKKNA
jgi:hypothetical protein